MIDASEPFAVRILGALGFFAAFAAVTAAVVARRSPHRVQLQHGIRLQVPRSMGTALSYLMLFIHLRIGPVTELSAVFGEYTSDIWL